MNENSFDKDNPILRAALMRGLVSRRSAMMGAAGVGAAAFLAACGSAGKNPSTGGASGTAAAEDAPRRRQDMSDTEKVVNWSNWTEYIDTSEDGKSRPTLDAFQKQTGIKVNYTEDYLDNDEFYAKVRPLLEGGKDTGRDVWCSTDWMVARLIRQGYVQKLDLANIPNAKNLDDSLKNVEFDPGRLYSLPWQSGFAGIGYNLKATGGKKIESITQLLTDPALKGKVTLLTEMRDTVGLVMMEQGKNIAKFTDADFQAAIDMIQKAKDSGQILRLHRQRVHRGPRQGRHRRVRRLDRRRRAAAVRRREHPVRPAGEGLHALVRQLRHPGARQAQEERREAHRLLLRPGRHGAGRRVGQLHRSGQGHQGGARQDRPRAR